MDAAQYISFHSRIQGCPERKFSRQLEAWLIPQTEKNIIYLLNHYSADEYEIDEMSRDLFKYTQQTKKLHEIKARRRWQYTFEGVVPTIKVPTKTKPYKHQLVGLDAVHDSEYFGLLMEMGTGKTKIIIDEICWSKIGKVLIVCPKTVIGTWIREFEKHAFEPYFIKRLRGHHRGVNDLLEGLNAPEKIKVWVTNYERVKMNLESLSRMKFDVMICDESTYIKNARAKRTKAIHELGETCSRRFLLTGTPAANSLMDLWAQFQFLSPGILGYSNYHAFKQAYARFKKTRGGFEKLVGYKRIDELQTRMASCSFVVKKKDCLDLPPKIYEERYVEMGTTQRALYEQMLQIALADLEGSLRADSTVQATVVVVQLLRLAQICCGYLKCIDGTERLIPDGDTKIEALKEIIETCDYDAKICIWARFRHDVRQIKALLHKMRISHACITGKQSENEREWAVNSFARDGGIRAIIGNPSAGGMGITLVGSPNQPCTTVVYYSNDFSMINRAQSEDRSHRIGTQLPVTYIDIVCEDSIEERICKVLQSKKELNDKLQNFEKIKHLLLGNGDSEQKFRTMKRRGKVEVPAFVAEQLAEETKALQNA